VEVIPTADRNLSPPDTRRLARNGLLGITLLETDVNSLRRNTPRQQTTIGSLSVRFLDFRVACRVPFLKPRRHMILYERLSERTSGEP
jgi:hypothetical protein